MLSIIISTYNESENILGLLDTIQAATTYSKIDIEMIVVDDNSPDNTGTLVEEYARYKIIKTESARNYRNAAPISNSNRICSVRVIHRTDKLGLTSAILQGIRASSGENILIMDADFSHSPELIPQMVDQLEKSQYDIVVASRYTKGGSVIGWPFKRRLISRGATKIAQWGLQIKIKDPMSGFFIGRRHIFDNLDVDTKGYKILLEILAKKRGLRVKEVPYAFTDRKFAASKMSLAVIRDYLRAVWILYRYGQKSKQVRRLKPIRKSIFFLSKIARFYTVGASGLLLNYSMSFSLANGLLGNMSYINATIVGIICSITSNFFLNKLWTFEDRNFAVPYTLRQYGKFVVISSAGAILQLLLVYLLTDFGYSYGLSLFTAVAAASMSNFLLNKKWTFQQHIWG